MSSESELRDRFIRHLLASVAGVAPRPPQEGDMVTLMIPSTVEDDSVGVSPASKAAIAAMPVVEMTEEEKAGDCAICLTEYGAGEEEAVKEMPCKHRYHSGCIEKWLGIHGSCPVCRYEMPADKEEEGKGGRRGIMLVVNIILGPITDGAPDRRTGSGDQADGQDHVDNGDR